MNNKNSIIILCKNIKLDKEHNNVLTYTEQEMVTLCYQNEISHASNYSFVKEDKGEIDVSFTYSECLQANYMAFQNPSYNNKWFFAFVDRVEYKSNLSTRIYYTIDQFATWFDYWNPSPCFVLREHTNDDTIGLNTVNEGLDLGDYIINLSGSVETSLENCYMCVGVTWLPDNTPFYTQNRYYGGVYSGLSYVLFKDGTSTGKFIRAIDDLGRTSSTTVVNIFPIPQILTGVSGSDERWFTASLGDQAGITACVLPNINYQTLRNDITLSVNNSLNGYTPKNNKLFVYPFNYLMISNNAGINAEFHYEDFTNNTPIFSLVGTVTPSCSIWLYPNNYKLNTVGGYNYGLPVAKYPQGSWNNDNYTNWLTSNGINLFGHRIDAPTSHAIGGSLQAILGAVAGNYEGIGAGLGAMFGSVQESYRASLIPNTVSGQVNSGDITYAYNQMSPRYYKMSIRREMAEKIDDWFTRFGYKTNRIKLPNQTGRENFNFVQIGNTENIGYSVYGVPSEAMNYINSLYRRGLTLWHNHTNLGNYNVSNNIV